MRLKWLLLLTIVIGCSDEPVQTPESKANEARARERAQAATRSATSSAYLEAATELQRIQNEAQELAASHDHRIHEIEGTLSTMESLVAEREKRNLEPLEKTAGRIAEMKKERDEEILKRDAALAPLEEKIAAQKKVTAQAKEAMDEAAAK